MRNAAKIRHSLARASKSRSDAAEPAPAERPRGGDAPSPRVDAAPSPRRLRSTVRCRSETGDEASPRRAWPPPASFRANPYAAFAAEPSAFFASFNFFVSRVAAWFTTLRAALYSA